MEIARKIGRSPYFITCLTLCASVLLCMANCPRDKGKTAKTPQSSVTVRASSGPMIAPPEVIAEFSAYLSSIMRKQPSMKEVECVPLEADDLAKIQAAQRLVAGQEQLPGSWKWPEVKKTVAAFGASLRICRPSQLEMDSPVAMGFEGRTADLWVWHSALMENTVAWIATQLIHEATHKVVLDETTERSRFTAEELAAISWECGEFNYNWLLATETLAFLNQARATDTTVVSWAATPPSAWEGEVMRAANGMAVGDTKALAAFAAWIKKYASSSYLKNDVYHGAHAETKCMPFPIIRGPHRGKPFVPVTVCPEILNPLVAAAGNTTTLP